MSPQNKLCIMRACMACMPNAAANGGKKKWDEQICKDSG